MIQTSFIVLSIVLLVVMGLVSIALTLRLNQVQQAFLEYREWAEKEIERVTQSDHVTGALKHSVFLSLLSNECRRSVREFTPLTLMTLNVKKTTTDELTNDELHNIAEVLKQQLSRPGDQLGRCGEHQLCLLLPSTNEHAGVFAEACHQKIKSAFSSSDFQFTLAACTFQPNAALNADMASRLVEETLVKALAEKPGEVLFHAEYSHDFNPMYT